MQASDELEAKIRSLGYCYDSHIDYKNKADKENNVIQLRYWKIPEDNSELANTPFSYTKEKDFCHFTTLEALYSIINSENIRLYNLSNMDDKYELEYARNELKFNDSFDNYFIKAKEQLFCFSVCSASEILNDETKEYLHWKLYGREGNGVIIKFCFQNDLNLWYKFHLAKMFYNTENFQPIKELNISTDNEQFDAKLACLIKLPIYKFENEIRLILDNRCPPFEKIHPDKLHKTDNIFYYELPLLNFRDVNDEIFLVNNFRKKNYERPKIMITEIILGYRYTESDVINIQNHIGTRLKGINIRRSKLEKYFNRE